MSLLSSIVKLGKKVLPSAATLLGGGGIGSVLTGLATKKAAGGALTKVPSMLPSVLPGVGKIGGKLGGKAGKYLPGLIGAVGGGVAVDYVLDQFGNPVPKKKRKRINPCNDKALRRALRRIEMYDKQRKRVDKALRSACPTPRRSPSRTSRC